MQLNESNRAIRGALTAATCSLLGLPQAGVAADNPWSVDTTLLYYQENDGRVQALEPVISATRDMGGDRFFNTKLVVDVLTGASPNGAAPSDQVQTFTRPSGSGDYATSAGDIPLDDTFRDTRGALSAGWQQPISHDTRINLGGNVSAEHDYASLGVNGAIARDFNDKNTTLSAGLALSEDVINPEGGIPTEFAAMVPAGDTLPRAGSDETKSLIDVLVGVTQVINRRTLMQFNYSMTQSDGYHSDPYKILSVVDAVTGRPDQYVYEKRPDSRTRNSVFWQTKYHLTRDVIDFSYRYFWDDWDISSHTVDLRYRWQFRDQHYLEPHVRYYQQSAADFYRHSLVTGAALPDYASADYRLAEFTGVTLGLKYGITRHNDDELSMRFEVYQQSGEAHPSDAVGVQRDYNMYPDLTAYIVQFSYAFR